MKNTQKLAFIFLVKKQKATKIFQQNLEDFEEGKVKTERIPRSGKLMDGGGEKKNQLTSWFEDDEDRPKIKSEPFFIR